MKKTGNINILNEEGREDEKNPRYITLQFFKEVTQIVFEDKENQVEDSNYNYNNISNYDKNNDWSKVDKLKVILFAIKFNLECKGNEDEIKRKWKTTY